MTKLRELLKAGKAAQDELRRLDLMEADAKAKIDAAVGENIESPAVQQAVSNAHVALTLVAARRKRLKQPLPEFRDLKAELGVQSVAFNERVAAAKEKQIDLLVAATVVQWFEGNEKACRRWWISRAEELPKFWRLRKSFHHMICGPPSELDYVAATEAFIAHIGRHAKALGAE
jgi:hypothetical protein